MLGLDAWHLVATVMQNFRIGWLFTNKFSLENIMQSSVSKKLTVLNNTKHPKFRKNQYWMDRLACFLFQFISYHSLITSFLINTFSGIPMN